LICTGFAALGASRTADADPAGPAIAPGRCPHVDGFIDGPFVPTKAATRRVYLATLAIVAPNHRIARHAKVVIEDAGDRWSVYEYEDTPPANEARGEMTVTIGGGGLSLQIDKCSGAVVNASLER
jgi:hypothetical protein